ncbi:hypothetical protein ACFOLG_16730 [Vogesella facilis]|uniref:Uncharacterized protein n=1 Tax=Vogesella facilis TaxID=1655232 RepID=A0ABV7RK57_9NEIS
MSHRRPAAANIAANVGRNDGGRNFAARRLTNHPDVVQTFPPLIVSCIWPNPCAGSAFFFVHFGKFS